MSPFREEWLALRRLAVPIVLTNLGSMAMTVVDTLMVGRMNDPQALAAASLANVWIHGTSIFAMGLVFGIDPIVTQAHGSRNGRRAGLSLHWGLVVAVVAGLVTTALWTATDDVLLRAARMLPSTGGGMSAGTIARAHEYMVVQAWSAVPFLAFVALRQYLQGREIVRPTLWVIVLANLFNVAANRVLIYGGLGFPALGLRGAGIATGIARALMLVILVGFVLAFRLQRGAWAPWGRASFSPRGVREVLRYGLPTALQMGFEVWAFGLATLMAGKLGDRDVSAHNIVLNIAATTFMVPMGVSFAAATRVGNLIGAGRRGEAQVAAWAAFAMGAGAMAVSALLLVGTGTLVPSLYFGDTSDPGVRSTLALCASIVPIAAAFQVFDGTQVVGSGILRGMGRTLPAAVINLVGYWFLALPIAYWLTFELDLGLRGIWWGLALALATVAAGLLAFVARRGPAHRTG